MSHRKWIWAKWSETHENWVKYWIVETNYILHDILIAMDVYKLIAIYVNLSKDNLSLVDLNQILNIFDTEFNLRKYEIWPENQEYGYQYKDI